MGGGDCGSGPNHIAVFFRRNTGMDTPSPLVNHKATNSACSVGPSLPRQWNVIYWRFPGGQIVANFAYWVSVK